MAPSAEPGALEAQYIVRDRHPDREAIYAEQRRLSDRTRSRLPCLADLAYGPRPEMRLDVFPAGRPGAATLLFLHGGYWKANNRHDVAFVAAPLVARGANAVLAGYPLWPAASLAEIAASAVAALAWCRANVRSWRGDPDRIAIAGHSAGGHLAALAATREAALGCIALSGLFDLRPLRQTSLAALLPDDEGSLAALSPTTRPPRCPVHLFTGGEETPEFARQAGTMEEAARRWGTRVTRETLPGLHHYSIVLALADGLSRPSMRIAECLGLDPPT